MKKLLLLLSILLTTHLAFSQLTPYVTDARDYANTNITPNTNRAITPAKLNLSLNKIIDAINYIDSLGFINAYTSGTMINDSTLRLYSISGDSSDFVISGGAGGGGGSSPAADQTLTATLGQTVFTFTGVPSSYNDFWLDINGSTVNQPIGYTKSGNNITMTATDIDAGSKLTLHFK